MSGGLQNGEYGVLNDGLEGVAGQIESLAVVIGIAGTSRFGRGWLKTGRGQCRDCFLGGDEPVVEESDADVIRVRSGDGPPIVLRA